MSLAADRPAPARIQGVIYAMAFFTGSQSTTVNVVMPLWALALGASPVVIGLIISARQILVVTLSIYGGALLDRYGARRMVIVLSVAGTATWLMFPVFPYIWAAIMIQMISGFVETTGWIGTQSMLGNYLHGRPAYAGRFTVGARLGGFAGPILLGLTWQELGPAAGFAFLALWTACGAVLAGILPELEPDPVKPPPPDAEPGPVPVLEEVPKKEKKKSIMPSVGDYTSTFRLLLLAPVALVVLNTFLRQAGSGIQASFYGVWLDQIGMSAGVIGTLIGMLNAVAAVSALSIGLLCRYIKPYVVLLIATIIAVVSIAMTPLFGTFFALAIAICFRGLGQGINFPLMLSIASQAVQRDQQGRVAALRVSFNKFGQSLVPLIMGVIAEFVGIEASFYVMGVVGFVTLSLVGLWASRSPAFKDT